MPGPGRSCVAPGAELSQQPVVAIGAVPDGSGYYVAASDGGVFGFPASATNFGSAAGSPLNKPVVAMAVAP